MQSPRRWKRFELQVAEKAGKKCLNTLETAWITRWETWGICRTTLDLFEPYLSIDHHSSLISSNFTLSIDRLTRGRGFLMARPKGRKLSTFTRRIKFQYEQEGNNTIYQPIYIRCRIVFDLIRCLVVQGNTRPDKNASHDLPDANSNWKSRTNHPIHTTSLSLYIYRL